MRDGALALIQLRVTPLFPIWDVRAKKAPRKRGLRLKVGFIVSLFGYL